MNQSASCTVTGPSVSRIALPDMPDPGAGLGPVDVWTVPTKTRYSNTNGSPSANSRDENKPALDKSEGRSSALYCHLAVSGARWI